MSPEQAQGKRLGPETDQFSLAVLSYEMLLGVNPWGQNQYSPRLFTKGPSHVYETGFPEQLFLALLQVWFINHGTVATLDDAEVFGSRALGIPLEVYYGKLCELASALAGDELC